MSGYVYLEVAGSQGIRGSLVNGMYDKAYTMLFSYAVHVKEGGIGSDVLILSWRNSESSIGSRTVAGTHWTRLISFSNY